MIDTLVHVTTPEGLAFDLRPAGPVPRLLAYILDYVCMFVVYGLLIYLLSTLKVTGNWLYLLILFVLNWFYMTIGEVCFKGRSIGKMALGLQVVMADGSLVTISASILRNILRAFDIFFAFGLLLALGNDGFRRAGDMVAGTLVVYKRHLRHTRPAPIIDHQFQARPPEQILPANASEPLLDLVRRNPQLSPALRQELAVAACDVYLYATNPTTAQSTVQELAAWYTFRQKHHLREDA